MTQFAGALEGLLAKIWPFFGIPQSVLYLLILARLMNNQPFALEAFQGIDELQLELDTESDSETVDPLDASRGILLAVAICVPFWSSVYSILF